MDKNTFSFELVDKYTPDTVIRNYLTQIAEATRGYVVGNIQEYSGHISSYTKTVERRSGVSGIKPFLVGKQENTLETVTVNIQSDLGELHTEQHKFEVFLTVKGLEHYKYRMMFVSYSAVAYPVTIVLNEKLAMEYSRTRKDTYQIYSMKQLEDMLNIVLDSDTMRILIQNLINESLRQEAKADAALPASFQNVKNP